MRFRPLTFLSVVFDMASRSAGVTHARRIDNHTARSVNQAAAAPCVPAAYGAGREPLAPFNESQYNLQRWQALHAETPSRFAHLAMPAPLPVPSPPAFHAHPPYATPNRSPPVNQPPRSDIDDHWTCGLEGCNIRLDDLSIGGQRRHLRDFHAAQLGSSRVRCTWVHEGGTICEKEMDPASWSKHLASVHWGSTKAKCPYCPKSICRRDALKRHIDNFHRDEEEI